MDSRTLHRLATNPKALMDFRATGRLPVSVKPKSPLITLLQSLHPRERVQIASVFVSEALGYTGARNFANAQQALNWLCPSGSSSCPASQSWQNKRFQKVLTIDDLAGVARVPDSISRDWWHRHSHLRHLQRSVPD